MPAIYPLGRPGYTLTPPEMYGPCSAANEYGGPMSGSMYGYNDHDVRRAFEAQNAYGGFAKQSLPMRDVSVDHAPSAIAGFSSALDRRDKVPSHMPAPILPPIRVPAPDTLVGASNAQHYANGVIGSRAVPQQQQAPPEKDASKATGGVAATLDYEMEHMVDFVAESAQAIVQRGVAVTPAFRKYVASILASTRLPSSTVVLALHYLATRMTLLSTRCSGNNTPNGSSGDGSSANSGSMTDLTAAISGRNHQLYLHLTTALMLASKFLDDNTFQNRSWADVSNIPVAELNRHELAWLGDIKWSLHIDPEDSTQGFPAWYAEWRAYQTRREAEHRAADTPASAAARSVESLKLGSGPDAYGQKHPPHRQQGFLPPPTPGYTPYGTETLNLPPWSVADRPSPAAAALGWGNTWPRMPPRDTPPSASWPSWPPPSAGRRDTVQPSPGSWDQWATAGSRRLTPPSAGHSGPATPDYYRPRGSVTSIAGYKQPPSQPQHQHQHQQGPPPPIQPYGALPLPPPSNAMSTHAPFDARPYASFHAPAWGAGGHNLGHGMGCGCGYCAHADRYIGGGWGMQTVVG